jgi:hypothetical protein
MRTASDVLTNPKPGDVIQIRLGWTRTVLTNDGEHVQFMATYNGMKNCGLYSVQTARWASSLDGMATTEVLHVAE